MSRNHHWWPVGLQRHWADKRGNVWSIDPDGKTLPRKYYNRKIATKPHGHTFLRETVWKTNFEPEFDFIDNKINDIILRVSAFQPIEISWTGIINSLRTIFDRSKNIDNYCQHFIMDEEIHKLLLELILSLAIRSPAGRFRYEKTPTAIGLPPDDEVGKMNMRQHITTAKEIIYRSGIQNRYFVIIHSPFKRFVFGDGFFDRLSISASTRRIYGRILIPLTPNLCIYFCTSNMMVSPPNCAAFTATAWEVDWINKVTQIHSRDQLFFQGRPPELSTHFRQRQFLQYQNQPGDLIDQLDAVSGVRRREGIFDLR